MRTYIAQQEPFIIPILVNANEGDNGESADHWALYFHYGPDQDGSEPRGYIIDPLSNDACRGSVDRISRMLGEGGELIGNEQLGAREANSYYHRPQLWVLHIINKLQEQMERKSPEVSSNDLVAGAVEFLRENELFEEEFLAQQFDRIHLPTISNDTQPDDNTDEPSSSSGLHAPYGDLF